MTSTRTENGQAFIIEPLKILGFNPNPLGVCDGITGAFVQEDVLGNAIVFSRLVNRIRETKRLEEKLKDKQLTTDQNDIAMFLKTISQYHETQFNYHLLHSYDMESISRIIGSKELKELGGLSCVYLDEVIYTEVEWCGYLEKIRKLIQQSYCQMSNVPFKLTMKIHLDFDGIAHALALSYDETQDQWIYTDPNMLPPFSILSTEKLEQNFLDAANNEWDLQPVNAYRNIDLIKLIQINYTKYFSSKYIPAVIQIFTVQKHPNISKIKEAFKQFKQSKESFCAPLEEIVKRVTSSGKGIVHLAAEADDVEKMETIIKAGGDIYQHCNGVSAIFKATVYGSTKIMSFFCRPEIKTDFDRLSKNGFTPAFIAAQKNRGEILEILANAKVNLGKTCKNKLTPLHVASQENSISALKVLLKKENNIQLNCVDDEGRTPFFYAMSNNHAYATELLVMAKADLMMPDYQGWFPQHIAAQQGSIEALKFLLKPEFKIDLNQTLPEGFSAISIAAINNKPQIIKLLAQAGADVAKTNNCGWTPLQNAAQKGHIQVLETILELDPKTNLNHTTPNGETAAFIAAQNNHFQFLRLLAEKDADLELSRNGKISPLHKAAYLGNMESVHVLQEFKCNPLKEDEDSHSAIYYALSENHWKVAGQLLKNIHMDDLSDTDKKLLYQHRLKLLPLFDNTSRSSYIAKIGFFKVEDCVTEYLSKEPSKCLIM